MEVTRPRQLVYFTYLATPTTEGMAYIFFAKDHYSEFVFQLDVELENSEAATLCQLSKLMNNKDFKTSPKKPFILMTSCGSDFKDKMQAAIRPLQRQPDHRYRNNPGEDPRFRRVSRQQILIITFDTMSTTATIQTI